jgi:hypothetical protein
MKLHLTLIPIIGAALAKGCARSGAEMSSIAATKVASRAGIYAARDYYQEDDQASIHENMLSAYSIKDSYSENIPNIYDNTTENEDPLKIDFQAKSKKTAQELMTRDGNFLEYFNLILDNTISMFESESISYEQAHELWKERTSDLNTLIYEISDSEVQNKFITQLIKQLEIIQHKKFKETIKNAESKLKQSAKAIEESKSNIQEIIVDTKSDSLKIDTQ